MQARKKNSYLELRSKMESFGNIWRKGFTTLVCEENEFKMKKEHFKWAISLLSVFQKLLLVEGFVLLWPYYHVDSRPWRSWLSIVMFWEEYNGFKPKYQ